MRLKSARDRNSYKSMHGKFVLHPFLDRRIPIITDGEAVDMTFGASQHKTCIFEPAHSLTVCVFGAGTGAVKITPAHDPNDFVTGKRHALQVINIFTELGTINEAGGATFAGMQRFEARVAIVAALTEKVSTPRL
jgi:valyl-tRNA synthetase